MDGVSPSVVVVDTTDGYVHWVGNDGFFTEATGRAFAEHRNAERKPHVPPYRVFRLAEVPTADTTVVTS